jgi:hypothetical protein
VTDLKEFGRTRTETPKLRFDRLEFGAGPLTFERN